MSRNMNVSIHCGKRKHPLPSTFATQVQLINNSEDESRLVFPKTIIYNPKVKTGNWFEEQHCYQKDNFKHCTEYTHAFYRKPLTTHPPSVKWDIELQSEGSLAIFPARTTDCLPNFHDNYTTSYDLSYCYLPKIAPRIDEHALPPLRKFGPRPVPELIESYGNISGTAISDAKKEFIKCERDNRKTAAKTLSQVDYDVPSKEAYNFRRRPRMKPIQTKTADIYPPLPPDHPKQPPECNFLTWECRDKNVIPTPPNYQLDCS